MSYLRLAGILAIFGCFITTANAQVLTSYTRPYEDIDLSISQPGAIYNLKVTLGDHVKAGDVIAELDNRVLQASLKLAKLREASRAEIDAAKAAAKLAHRRWENVKRVHADGHASETEFESVQLELEQAQAELRLAVENYDQARVEVERFEAEIEQRVARSPIDGVIVRLPRDPGEYISASEPSIARIVQVDQVRVTFHVTTAHASRLRVGNEVQIQLVDERRKDPVAGEIEYISIVTDADSDTVQVDVVIDNSDGLVRSGLPCEFLVPSAVPSVGSNIVPSVSPDRI